MIYQIAAIVLCAVYISLVIVRSRNNERYCQQRDRDFNTYLEHLKQGNETECRSLLTHYEHDRFFVIQAQRASFLKKAVQEVPCKNDTQG